MVYVSYTGSFLLWDYFDVISWLQDQTEAVLIKKHNNDRKSQLIKYLVVTIVMFLLENVFGTF